MKERTTEFFKLPNFVISSNCGLVLPQATFQGQVNLVPLCTHLYSNMWLWYITVPHNSKNYVLKVKKYWANKSVGQWFAKCGPQINSISMTGTLVRDENTHALSWSTESETLGVAHTISILSPPRDSTVCQSLRTTDLVQAHHCVI